MNITSQTGAYFQTRSGVALRGNVIVKDSGRRMTMETEMLDANLSSGDLQTNRDVRVKSDDALVVAQGMRVFGEVELRGGWERVEVGWVSRRSSAIHFWVASWGPSWGPWGRCLGASRGRLEASWGRLGPLGGLGNCS